jgi:hypothetical protein
MFEHRIDLAGAHGVYAAVEPVDGDVVEAANHGAVGQVDARRALSVARADQRVPHVAAIGGHVDDADGHGVTAARVDSQIGQRVDRLGGTAVALVVGNHRAGGPLGELRLVVLQPDDRSFPALPPHPKEHHPQPVKELRLLDAGERVGDVVHTVGQVDNVTVFQTVAVSIAGRALPLSTVQLAGPDGPLALQGG